MKVSTIYNKGPRYTLFYAMLLALLVILLLLLYQRFLALFLLVAWVALAIYFKRVEMKYNQELEDYILTTERRIKRSEAYTMSFLPFGAIVIDSEGDIAWFNEYVTTTMDMKIAVGQSFSPILSEIFRLADKNGQLKESSQVFLRGRHFQIKYIKQEGIIYILDKTDYQIMEQKLYNTNLVLGILQLDNFHEISKDLNEHDTSLLMAEVVSLISEWAHKYNILLKRTQQESFLIILDTKTLLALEEAKFEILEQLKKLEEKTGHLTTISIGIAAGDKESILVKGQQAQESLDLALARGGDQVAVKRGERITYFGGRTDAVEKRTKVRARVMAHSLRELILSSDNVYIMPHIDPDADAIGSALGVLSIVQSIGKVGYIVLEKANPTISKIIKYLDDHGMRQYIMPPEEALVNIRRKSLLICVDHNKPGLSIEKRLLNQTNQIVVIDHHRRTEDIIENTALLYIEPSASSTCELITELIEYQYRKVRLSQVVATLLMAGIVVDTKNFLYQTGSRTFEAASFLRREGADSIILNRLLADDMELFALRTDIVQSAKIKNCIAIARTVYNPKYGNVVVAQAANTLINMEGVKASFVLQETDYGVSISARSLGDVNVQLVMEALGGGGHLTTAAAQLKDVSLDEAEKRLKQVITDACTH